MDNGADPMIPNIAKKETAFHYCGLSGNAEVILVKYSGEIWWAFYYRGGEGDNQAPENIVFLIL